MLFTNESLNRFAKDPAVVRFRDRYLLYYSVKYGDGRFGIGIAASTDTSPYFPRSHTFPFSLPFTQRQEGIGMITAIGINRKYPLS